MGPVYVFCTLLISFKELWRKTESARSNLRTSARSRCKYTFRTYQLFHIVYLNVNENRWLFSVHNKPFTFCLDKYEDTRKKLVDLNFAPFSITKWKLVYRSCTKSSEWFRILKLNWQNFDEEGMQQKPIWEKYTSIFPLHLCFHLCVCTFTGQ